jgi:hypothetical protein
MSHLLVFPELGCREFGSGLILTESFLRLAAEKGWRLPPECRLEGFDLLHIESALNSLTVAQPAVSREVAVMLLAGSAAAEHELAEKLPQWVLRAAYGNLWRRRIRDLLATGELALVDPISREEVQAVPAGAPDAASAPVPAPTRPDEGWRAVFEDEGADWRERARARASAWWTEGSIGEIRNRSQAAEFISRWCRQNDVRGRDGPPGKLYLRNHILDVKHWMPPSVDA